MNLVSVSNVFKSNALLRNAMTLTSGTAFAQAILWLATPVLTRLFAPEEYGSLGVFVSLAGIFSTFATLRFDQAIILERDKESADHVFALCVAVSCMFAVLAIAVGSLIYGVVDASWKSAQVFDYWLLIPIAAMAMGVRNAANMRLIKSNKFKVVATADILQTGSSVAVQMTAGLAGVGAVGLIGGNVAGITVALILVLVCLARAGNSIDLKSIDFARLWHLARFHHRFALFNVPSVLLERLSRQFPVLFLAAIYSPLEAGFFWLSYRLLLNPVRLLTDRSRKAYYLRAAELSEQGQPQERLFVKVTLVLGGALIFPMAVLALLGPGVFELVFGEEWRRAGEYVRWLCIIPIFMLLRVPSMELAPIYNQQKQVLFWQTFESAVRVVALIAGSLLGDDVFAIALFSVAAATTNIMFVMYFWRLISRRSIVPSSA